MDKGRALVLIRNVKMHDRFDSAQLEVHCGITCARQIVGYQYAAQRGLQILKHHLMRGGLHTPQDCGGNVLRKNVPFDDSGLKTAMLVR